MYSFARKCRILSKYSCFAIEGSHRRLKRTLRINTARSLVHCRLGVQVVVDNHTIDYILRREGWDVTKSFTPRQGPVTVRQVASWARKRALGDLNYVNILMQPFTIHKR